MSDTRNDQAIRKEHYSKRSVSKWNWGRIRVSLGVVGSSQPFKWPQHTAARRLMFRRNTLFPRGDTRCGFLVIDSTQSSLLPSPIFKKWFLSTDLPYQFRLHHYHLISKKIDVSLFRSFWKRRLHMELTDPRRPELEFEIQPNTTLLKSFGTSVPPPSPRRPPAPPTFPPPPLLPSRPPLSSNAFELEYLPNEANNKFKFGAILRLIRCDLELAELDHLNFQSIAENFRYSAKSMFKKLQDNIWIVWFTCREGMADTIPGLYNNAGDSRKRLPFPRTLRPLCTSKTMQSTVSSGFQSVGKGSTQDSGSYAGPITMCSHREVIGSLGTRANKVTMKIRRKFL